MAELDVDRWSAPPDATITVWHQDLPTGANRRLCACPLGVWLGRRSHIARPTGTAQ
jgi:hypothetical protein